MTESRFVALMVTSPSIENALHFGRLAINEQGQDAVSRFVGTRVGQWMQQGGSLAQAAAILEVPEAGALAMVRLANF